MQDMFPNNRWSALLNNQTVTIGEDRYVMSTIDCGKLKVNSGQLVCCDPFSELAFTNPFVSIPKGEYDVIVTIADVSQNSDQDHLREAYASLIIDGRSTEVTRKYLIPQAPESRSDPVYPNPVVLSGNSWEGFGVDSGTACFVDNYSLEEGMPKEDCDWYDQCFDHGNNDPPSWFNLMDDPNHISTGIANISLPQTKVGNNLILFHSGWGDGFYPIIGGYNQNGELISVHIDFGVIPLIQHE